MRILFLSFAIFFYQWGISQVDTLALKKQIDQIGTEKNHIDFWDFVFERDQNMFQSDHLEKINIENLVLVSYYLNKFGYPDINILGDKAKILNMVWVHNKYDEVKKLTYPIILQGYLKKEISEFNLREYFLRILYQNYFHDHGHMTKSLSEIYRDIQPNLTGHINVYAFVQYYTEQEKYFSGDKITLGTWKSDDIQYTGTLNGNSFSHTLPGSRMTINKMPDGKYFFQILVSGQSIEPKELKLLNEESTSFQFSRFQNEGSYEITGNGDLLFRDEKGNITTTFHPVTQ